MNNYAAQKIRICIATYFNLYGTRPSIQEMIDWTGEEYQTVLQVMDNVDNTAIDRTATAAAAA